MKNNQETYDTIDYANTVLKYFIESEEFEI